MNSQMCIRCTAEAELEVFCCLAADDPTKWVQRMKASWSACWRERETMYDAYTERKHRSKKKESRFEGCNS